MSVPKVLKLTPDSNRSSAEMGDFIALEDLPTNILQAVCQILIRSDNFNSVLSLRLACRNLYELINDFTLFLALRCRFYDALESEMVTNHVNYLTEKTNWRLEKLEVHVYYKNKEWQKWDPEAMLQFLQDYRQFFGEKLRILSVQSNCDGTNIHYCNEIARIVCNDHTILKLGSFYSAVRGEDFSFCDRVSSFELYVETEMNSKCFLWKFANLEKLRVVCFDKQLDIWKHFRLGNLKELRVDCIKSLFHLAPFPSSEAFFPKVKYLYFNEYKRNDDRFGAFLSLHFPNLEHLEVYTDHEFLEKYLTAESISNFGQMEEVVDDCGQLLPPNCVTLKTTVFFFCNVFIPISLSQLYLEIDLSAEILPTILQHIKLQLGRTAIKILNIQFGRGDFVYDIDHISFKQMAQFIVNVIESVSTLEVFTVASNVGVKSTQLRNWADGYLKKAKHNNLKVLIVGSVPLLLRPDISPALMARIDYLTVKHDWTLRRNCDNREMIDFNSCK